METNRLHEALLNKTLTMPPLAEARQKELLTIGVLLLATLRGLEPLKMTRQLNETQQAYGHRLRETGQDQHVHGMRRRRFGIKTKHALTS